jgi:hypothetical protein
MRTNTADHGSIPKPDSFRPSASRIDLSIAGLWGFFCLGTSQPVLANEASPTPGVIIDEHIRTAVIDAAAKALEDKYVFPDVGKQMPDKIRQDNASKTYDTITTGEDLSHRLTEDLYAVAHDRHIRIQYPDSDVHPGPPTAEQMARFQQRVAWTNFGFPEVKRLAGKSYI